MLERAGSLYAETARLIRVEADKHELFSQLLMEEVILYYKICKTKGLPHSKMLTYLELIVERLTGMRNGAMLAKILGDLAQDTLKFKVNEVPSSEVQGYVSKVNSLLNAARGACGKAQDGLLHCQAKLNLAFALIIDSQTEAFPSKFQTLDGWFEKAIKQLKGLKADNESHLLDLAAANYHRGRFIITHLTAQSVSKSDAAKLSLAKDCLRTAVSYFQGKPLDSLKGLLSIIQVLSYELTASAVEAKGKILEAQDAFQQMRGELQVLRKTRREMVANEAMVAKIDRVLEQCSESAVGYTDVLLMASAQYGFRATAQAIAEFRAVKRPRQVEEVIKLISQCAP